MTNKYGDLYCSFWGRGRVVTRMCHTAGGQERSKAQLDLIGALDDIEDSFMQFFSINEDRICHKGRMLIAQRAIDLAVSKPPEGQPSRLRQPAVCSIRTMIRFSHGSTMRTCRTLKLRLGVSRRRSTRPGTPSGKPPFNRPGQSEATQDEA